MEPPAKQRRIESSLSKSNNDHINYDTIRLQPLSLLDLCLQYICFHINVVESLVNFPDIIGQKIFHLSHDAGQMTANDKQTERIMRLFSDAYLSDVLYSVNLSNCHLGISDYFPLLSVFVHVCEMDLSHCGLGDEHEMLEHFVHLNQLVKLSLKKNALTDDGLRRLTTPMRVLKRGPLNLAALDLSENKCISQMGTKYLKCFRKLASLNLTDTSVKDGDVPAIEKQLDLVRSCDPLLHSPYEVSERGWAVGLVHEWMHTSEARATRSKHHQAQSSFYSGMKIKRSEIRRVESSEQSQEPFHFVKPSNRDEVNVSRENATLQPIKTKPNTCQSTSHVDFAKQHLDIYADCYLNTITRTKSTLLQALENL